MQGAPLTALMMRRTALVGNWFLQETAEENGLQVVVNVGAVDHTANAVFGDLVKDVGGVGVDGDVGIDDGDLAIMGGEGLAGYEALLPGMGRSDWMSGSVMTIRSKL